jgi:hypothetical protein
MQVSAPTARFPHMSPEPGVPARLRRWAVRIAILVMGLQIVVTIAVVIGLLSLTTRPLGQLIASHLWGTAIVTLLLYAGPAVPASVFLVRRRPIGWIIFLLLEGLWAFAIVDFFRGYWAVPIV